MARVVRGRRPRREENLYFRNLDGTGTQHRRDAADDIGTLTVRRQAHEHQRCPTGMIIHELPRRVMSAGDQEIYTLKTVFGFFPGDTCANQLGIPRPKSSARPACTRAIS
jgi:hypothetical protein